MRNALRDAELPPPAGGWERLQRELGGAAPGPEVSGTKPRGSVWRIYRPRIAAAAAAVLILAVAGELLLRPDKALENDGTVIASVAEDGATAVAIPQPVEPETVRDALAKAVGLPREQVAGEASSAGRRSLFAAAAGQPAQTAALKNLRTDGEPAVRPGEVAAEVSGEAAKASSGEVGLRRYCEGGGFRRKGFEAGFRAARNAVGGWRGRSCGVLRRAVRSLHQTA